MLSVDPELVEGPGWVSDRADGATHPSAPQDPSQEGK